MLKKILTFKSGQFVFSRKFSDLDKLLIEAQVLYGTIVDLPILPELAARIEKEVIIRSIFATAAIEGNPLTEEKVAEIISKPEGKEKFKDAEKEIRNLKSVYDFIAGSKVSEKPFKLSEDSVKNIHSIITKDIEHKYNVPGQYRSHRVKVGNEEHGGVYTPPKILEDIKTLMREFMRWINSKELLALDPTIRAALAHYHLGLIHPFGDGNGRTARVVEALLLQLAGIKYIPLMLSNFYYRNIDAYFWALSNSRKNKENEVSAFLRFVLEGFIDSLKEIKGKITFYIRKFTLRDYYSHLRTKGDISQRQHDFLIMLLDYPKPFALEDLVNISPFNILYRKVSERTARRDLKKLGDKGLLRVKKGKYELHFRVLG
ncbi:MAG TPA: Fic family protein [Ignavibacteria bacterium]|nr:Fic family protein [Ignavibacteria bacterium]